MKNFANLSGIYEEQQVGRQWDENSPTVQEMKNVSIESRSKEEIEWNGIGRESERDIKAITCLIV